MHILMNLLPMNPEKIGRILCVNDNDIMLFILKQIIQKSNFGEDVVLKSNGSEALDYCRDLIRDNENYEELYPRLIFLDLYMPEMDGWEFLDQFSSEIQPYFRETKVVITSQSVDGYEIERCRQYPFVVDFMSSAITTEYLEGLRNSLPEREAV